MRIAIFSDAFYPKIDGVSISLQESVRYLAKRGHDILIYAPDNLKGMPEIDFGSNVEIKRIFSIPFLTYKEVHYAFPDKKKILEEVSEWKPDMLYMASFGPIGLVTRFVKKKLNAPVVGSFNTIFAEQLMYVSPMRLFKIDKLYEILFQRPYFESPKDQTFLKERMWKYTSSSFSFCDRIVVPSPPIKTELEKRKLKNPIDAIPLGFDLSKIEKRDSDKKITHKIVHVGRLSHEKKIHIVIDAFVKLHEKQKNATLDIIGDGPARSSLELYARRKNLNNLIRFHGYMPSNQLIYRYQDFDLFMTASDMETLGIVCLEAMAAGLPVVGVDKYALPSIISHEKNGMICPPNDSSCLAGSALRILSNKERYRQLSKHAIKSSVEFGIEHAVVRLENMFEDVLKKHKGSKSEKPAEKL